MKREEYSLGFSRKLRHQATVWEMKLWRYLRAGRLDGFKFKRQVVIEKYIVDFCCNEKKIIIELDGESHRGSVTDKHRDNFFTTSGYTVLRFWNYELDKNFERVLEKIYKTIYAKKI